MMVGSVTQSANVDRPVAASALVVLLLLAANVARSEALYKYQGPDGEWIYTDRPPVAEQTVEVRDLPKGESDPQVTVFHRYAGGLFSFHAKNEYHAPVEVILALDKMSNLGLPPPDQRLRWVVPPRDQMVLMELPAGDGAGAVNAEYRYLWLAGDPETEHRPERPYRAPFAVSTDFMVSQAFPNGFTHQTPDSYYAVDLAMPIGTDIYAARGGTVFEVASTNFRGGLNPERDLASANLIRILHDDGTIAIYAHLNWNSIRVRPGDRVQRGEYIAESGNTGFSSGPHLHFAVIRNRGMRQESVPIVFEGPNNTEIEAKTGVDLTAY